MSLAQRTRSLWARLGLATTPGDPEEARAFLQRRISFFVGVCFLLWMSIGVSSELAALSLPAGQKPLAHLPTLLHHLGSLALGCCWWLVRRGERGRLLLNAVDAGSTVGQTAFIAAVMTTIELRFRPDMSITMGSAYILIARAALVPSDAVRTLAIGLASALSVVGGALVSHLQVPLPERTLPVAVAVAQIATWSLLGVLLSVVISRVIYGLRQRVQASMRLGQYTLERKLGEGGMGVVYLARHALLRRPTAIKLLHPERSSGALLVRFEREVQLTSTLRNPNTIVVYDYGRTPEGVFYYVMEYLDGASLEELVTRTGPLPESRVVHILTGLSSALEEAHAVGLVHRDIKPGNAFVCRLGQHPDFVKLLDFGLVKDTVATGDVSATGVTTIMGTPLYLSPEAIVTPHTVDARSDLYALGAVAYFLLTGKPPFLGSSMMEVCAQHLHAPVVPPSQRLGRALEPALESLVLSCLEKDPTQRPASARELLARLERVTLEPWTRARAELSWSVYEQLAQVAGVPDPTSGLANTVAVDLEGRLGSV